MSSSVLCAYTVTPLHILHTLHVLPRQIPPFFLCIPVVLDVDEENRGDCMPIFMSVTNHSYIYLCMCLPASASTLVYLLNTSTLFVFGAAKFLRAM